MMPVELRNTHPHATHPDRSPRPSHLSPLPRRTCDAPPWTEGMMVDAVRAARHTTQFPR